MKPAPLAKIKDEYQVNPVQEQVKLESTPFIYRALEAELMKKQGKDVTPEDYKKLLEELSSLKKALAEERLRADFYQEMVAYGEEVYGIKLKKAGTK